MGYEQKRRIRDDCQVFCQSNEKNGVAFDGDGETQVEESLSRKPGLRCECVNVEMPLTAMAWKRSRESHCQLRTNEECLPHHTGCWVRSGNSIRNCERAVSREEEMKDQKPIGDSTSTMRGINFTKCS